MLAIFFSCAKEEPSGYYWGITNAQFNGDAWEAQLYAIENKPYNQGIDFIMHKFSKQGILLEILHFYKIPPQIGKYPFADTEVRDIDSLVGARFRTVLDGDVTGDTYSLLEGVVNNYVEITKIEGDQVWADFQVAFVKGSSNNSPEYPDTIVFKNGKIHTRIVEPK